MLLRSLWKRLFSTAAAAIDASTSSFTVQFMTSACGLPLPSAVSAARTVTLTPSSVPNCSSILSLLESHRFSPAEISALVSARPSLLLSRPSLLSPKLHLLLSLHRLPPSLISANPQILSRSLANHIQPTMELLHSFLGGSSHLLLSALRRFRRLLTSSPAVALAPNLALLLSLCFPRPHIAKLLSTHPRPSLPCPPASPVPSPSSPASASTLKPSSSSMPSVPSPGCANRPSNQGSSSSRVSAGRKRISGPHSGWRPCLFWCRRRR